MQETLDTVALAPQDRADAVRALVWGSLVRVDIDHRVPVPDVSVSLSLGSCGDRGVCATRATATTVRRTPRLAREDSEPMVFLTLQERTLAARILADLRAHLVEPGLSPAAVAARHHISVRYLHRVLQREGIRFGEWVRHQRLEATRQELSHARQSALPVAAIARRWGFPDPAHFSRTFRAAYGMSPREWRAGPGRGATAPDGPSHRPAGE